MRRTSAMDTETDVWNKMDMFLCLSKTFYATRGMQILKVNIVFVLGLDMLRSETTPEKHSKWLDRTFKPS